METLLRDLSKEEQVINIKARYTDTLMRLIQEGEDISKDMMARIYRELIMKESVKEGDILLGDIEELCVEIYEGIKVEDENEDVYKLIDDLNNNVVRLVFMKKNGELREMWGTRNPDLVGKYCNKAITVGLQDDFESKESVKAQVLGDYIKLLDLEKKEFRTFKPSNLVTGELSGIPTWVTCEIDNDAWYKVLYEGEDIKDYLDGTTLKQAEMSFSRRRAEVGAVLTAITNGVLLEEDTEEDIKKVSRCVEKYVGLYQNTVSQMELPEEYLNIVGDSKFREALIGLLAKYKELNPNLTVGKTPVSKTNGLYILNVGTDNIYVHPYYIVNSRTGKVYLDRFGKMSKELEGLRTDRVKSIKRIDKVVKAGLGRLIEEFGLRDLPLTVGRVTKVDPRYVKRQQRLEYVVAARNDKAKDMLDQLGLKLMEVKGTKTVRVNKAGTRDIVAYITPNILKVMVKVQGEFREYTVVHSKTSNSLLTEWEEGIRGFKRQIQTNKELDEFIDSIHTLMVGKVLDLRVKRILEL